MLRTYFIANTEHVPDKEIGKTLAALGERMHPPVPERLNVILINDAQDKPFKAYEGDANHCYDIFARAKDTGEKGKWTGRVISRFDANRPGFQPQARASTGGSPLIMRLRVNNVPFSVDNLSYYLS